MKRIGRYLLGSNDKGNTYTRKIIIFIHCDESFAKGYGRFSTRSRIENLIAYVHYPIIRQEKLTNRNASKYNLIRISSIIPIIPCRDAYIRIIKELQYKG